MSQSIEGRVIKGRYKVEKFIATGGVKTVYKVLDLHRNTHLAMKLLHSDLEEDHSVLRSFQRDAKALERLAHPNIVRFYGLDRDENSFFILEEYIDGPSLKDILKDRKTLPVIEAIAYIKALCAALGFVHANGVVHCDVKPGNVMVNQSGVVLLTDFGIARHASSDSTSTFAGAGTPAYMAPEQVRGDTVTAETDIYALGLMIFEMLTGQRPFRGNEAGLETAGNTQNERIRFAHLKMPPPNPRQINPGIPQGIATAILTALSKNPAERYSDTQQFLQALCDGAGIREADIPARVTVPKSYSTAHEASTSRGSETQAIPVPARQFWPQTAPFFAVALIALLVLGFFYFRPSGKTSFIPTQADITPKVQAVQPVQTKTIANADPVAPKQPAASTSGQAGQVEFVPTKTSITLVAAPTITPKPSRPTSTPTDPPPNRNVVLVDEGAFLMGATDRDIQINGGGEKFVDELPAHTVFLNAFHIDKTEVTNQMFEKFINSTGYVTTAEMKGKGYVTTMDKERADEVSGADWRHPNGPGSSISGKEDYPVVQLSWYDAQEYCRWAGGRLPTEAEWEKAARGMMGSAYPWGDADLQGNYANSADAALNSDFWSDRTVDDGYRLLAPVGSFPDGISPYGALDMSGNAWEWVNDWYSPDFYSTGSANMDNPEGPASGTEKVLKGGSYLNGRKNVRPARRGNVTPESTLDLYGFRCVYD